MRAICLNVLLREKLGRSKTINGSREQKGMMGDGAETDITVVRMSSVVRIKLYIVRDFERG